MNQQYNLTSIEEDEKRLEQAPNLPISSAPLKAAIHQIHSACKSYMDNFMLCKRANGNPQSCVDQNIQLTKCTFEAYHLHLLFFTRLRIRLIQEKCNETYTNYWKCLDSNNHLFWMCREEEVAFNNCTKQKCVSFNYPVMVVILVN